MACIDMWTTNSVNGVGSNTASASMMPDENEPKRVTSMLALAVIPCALISPVRVASTASVVCTKKLTSTNATSPVPAETPNATEGDPGVRSRVTPLKGLNEPCWMVKFENVNDPETNGPVVDE